MHKLILNIFLCVLLSTPIMISQNQKNVFHFHLNKNEFLKIENWEYLDIVTNNKGVDSIGTTIKLNDYNSFEKKTHLLRKRVRLYGEMPEFDQLFIHFWNVPLAYSVYWDGIFIGKNGSVGKDRESEISGKIRYSIPIKKEYLTSGEHAITLQLSNFNSRDINMNSEIFLVFQSVINSNDTMVSARRTSLVGVYLCLVFVALSIYFSGWKQLSFLFVGIYALLMFAVFLWSYLLVLNFLSMDITQWLNPTLLNFIPNISPFFLVLFTIWFLEISKKKIYLILSLGLFIIITIAVSNFSHHDSYLVFLIVSLFYCIILILTQRKSKIPGSYVLLFSFGVTAILKSYVLLWKISVFSSYLAFWGSFVLVLFFVISIIIAISLKIQYHNKIYQVTLLKAERLENELLKKSIQPHFIMNTLFSIKSILSTKPSVAEKIIDTLAQQFRIINEISSKNEISLADEIQLCKLHLELMGYRFNAEFQFIYNNEKNNIHIPPLIIHTLVENAFTHAYKAEENGIFYFDVKQDEKDTILKLSNDGSKIEIMQNKLSNKIEEGLGIKYVKTRLEETYLGKWNLKYGIVNDLWEVKITIQK